MNERRPSDESIRALYKRASDETVGLRSRRFSYISIGISLIGAIIGTKYLFPNIEAAYLRQCGLEPLSFFPLAIRILVVLGVGILLVLEIFLFERQIVRERNILRLCERCLCVLESRGDDPSMGGDFQRKLLRWGSTSTMLAPFTLALLVVPIATLEVIKAHGCGETTAIGLAFGAFMGLLILGGCFWIRCEKDVVKHVSDLEKADAKWVCVSENSTE